MRRPARGDNRFLRRFRNPFIFRPSCNKSAFELAPFCMNESRTSLNCDTNLTQPCSSPVLSQGEAA